MDWQALWVSLQLAFATSLILLGLGLPIAYWLAHSGNRLKFLIDAFLTLPFVLPPTVIGFFCLLLFSRLGGHLAFSFLGLLIGSVIFNLPIAVQPFTAAIKSVDSHLSEAAYCLGWSKLAVFRYVVFPLAWTGLLAGVLLSFAHTLGEFGVAMMVGGNIPGVTRTISMSVYDSVQSMETARASETALMQLGICLFMLSLISYLKGRKSYR